VTPRPIAADGAESASRAAATRRAAGALIGVVSDTHGLLRAEALAALEGSDLIVHAGDVGDPLVLEELRRLAPTVAVRGNVDRGEWAEALPATEVVEVAGVSLYVLHRIGDLDLDPVAAGISAVIYGHSHRPHLEWRDDVLLLNPGSAGPRRFNLPLGVARIRVVGGALEAALVAL
jgi:putative phosphoesterase